MSIGDLDRFLVYHMVIWMKEMLPHTALPEACRRAGPEVIRIGELPWPLTYYSTQESKPCTN